MVQLSKSIRRSGVLAQWPFVERDPHQMSHCCLGEKNLSALELHNTVEPAYRIEGTNAGDIHKLKFVMKKAFFYDEPTAKLFGLTGDEYNGEILDVMIDGINLAESFIARSNATDEVIGFALNSEYSKDKPDADSKRWADKIKDARNRKLLTLWGSISRHFDYACVTPIARAMELCYLGVVPDARRQGLAKKLVTSTMMLAKKKRYGLVQIVCTSNRTASICKSLGLTPACRIEYGSLVMPTDGRPVVTRPPPCPDHNINIYYHLTC